MAALNVNRGWSDDTYLLWQRAKGTEDVFLALDSPRDGHLVIENFQSCHPLHGLSVDTGSARKEGLANVVMGLRPSISFSWTRDPKRQSSPKTLASTSNEEFCTNHKVC